MVFVLRPFHAYPHRFVGLNNTSIFRTVSNFHLRLNSSSSRSMKKIPRNLLTCSRFSLSIACCCFSLRFGASDICLHISVDTMSGLEVVCSLVNLLQDLVYPYGGLLLKKVNHVTPVHASDNSLSPSTFQDLQYVSPISRLKLWLRSW